MKKELKVIALLVALVLSGIVYGQDLSVSDTIGVGINVYPDTLTLNDNYTHQVTIKNYDANPFTGNIYLMAGIDTNGTLFSVDTVGMVFVSSFMLYDTVSIFYTETYSIPNGYKTGDNIVVVWPVTDFGITLDTLRKNIYIDDPISVNEINVADEQLFIYPNPFRDHFFIQNLSIKKDVKQIKLFDANGRLVYNEKYNKEIKMESFNKGLYFLEIEFFDNSKKYKKLIKN